MKKGLVVKIRLVVIICVTFAIAILIVNYIDYSKHKYIPAQGNEEIYNLTEEEVAQINANSNMLGCTLLADAPERATTAVPEGIRDFYDDNYFMCFPYRGRQCITEINLFSEEANIFGMSVGDDVEKASSILLDAGCEMNNGSQPNEKAFGKYYVHIYFG